MVLPSVVAMLLLLSLLATSAGNKSRWLLQSAQHDSAHSQVLTRQRSLLTQLYGLDAQSLTAAADSGQCLGLHNGYCIQVEGQSSSMASWGFTLFAPEGNHADVPLSGWIDAATDGSGKPAQVLRVRLGDSGQCC
ncbi:MAG: hypothetical protein GWP70_05050 [Proteobacteria bacterium]|nr:hypothetical protein [Pseudomonadota bacterium]